MICYFLNVGFSGICLVALGIIYLQVVAASAIVQAQGNLEGVSHTASRCVHLSEVDIWDMINEW